MDGIFYERSLRHTSKKIVWEVKKEGHIRSADLEREPPSPYIDDNGALIIAIYEKVGHSDASFADSGENVRCDTAPNSEDTGTEAELLYYEIVFV